MQRDKKTNKFCIAGSAQIGKINNANRKSEKWNDYIKQGSKISLFLPLYKTVYGDIDIAISGAYCHSIPKAIRDENQGLPGMILSTVERDLDNGSVLDADNLDIFSKLAIISKIAFSGEKAKAWADLDSRTYTTELERKAAIDKWTKNYLGVQEEGNSFKTRGKQPAMGIARMVNYAVGIACTSKETGKLDTSNAKLVHLMPSAKRNELFRNALDKLLTQYMANKREDPSMKEPTILELVFDIGKDKDTDTKKQQVEPSGVDYLSSIEIAESRAKELKELEPYFRLLPKDPQECYDRNRGFDPKDGASILLKFKVLLMDGLQYIDLIEDDDDKSHIERNVKILKEVFANDADIDKGIKALNIKENQVSNAESIKEEINREHAQIRELEQTIGSEGIEGEVVVDKTPVAPVPSVAPVSQPTQPTHTAPAGITMPTGLEDALAGMDSI